jgi:hypothetical protein
MSVVRCSRCDAYYWRYRADTPPTGYCSVFCKENRKRKAEVVDKPPAPEKVLESIYGHRRERHGGAPILAQFDCDTCYNLETLYRRSIDWYIEENARKLEKQRRAKSKRKRERIFA